MAKKRNRIPKRVAGVKVPKALRKGRLGRFLATPMGQAIIVESVVRAGEQLISRDTREAVGDAAAHSGERIGALGQNAADRGVVLANALREAGRAFVAALNEGRAPREAPGPEGYARGEARLEKKERAVRDEPRTAH